MRRSWCITAGRARRLPLPNDDFMNANEPKTSALPAYVIGILGSFLIVACLVWAMRYYTSPAPVGQARVEERKKNLTELRSVEAEGLNNYAWVDQGKGIVRLPVARAIEITLQEYQSPAAARSNRVARAEKAATPAPKAPETPSAFE